MINYSMQLSVRKTEAGNMLNKSLSHKAQTTKCEHLRKIIFLTAHKYLQKHFFPDLSYQFLEM